MAKEEDERAESLGQNLVDDIHILNQVGWGRGSGGPVELAIPSQVLSRALARYRDSATKQIASEESEEERAREEAKPFRQAAISTIEMCERLLGELDPEDIDQDEGRSLNRVPG